MFWEADWSQEIYDRLKPTLKRGRNWIGSTGRQWTKGNGRRVILKFGQQRGDAEWRDSCSRWKEWR